jgi:hypothetical protein
LLGFTLSLLIQKLAIKTASLPIHKLATNCVAADLEIDNQKLYRFRFENQQSKTLPVPI